MAKRNVYHVAKNPDGGWDVKKEGAKRASTHSDRKKDAISRGNELAKSGSHVMDRLRSINRTGNFRLSTPMVQIRATKRLNYETTPEHAYI